MASLYAHYLMPIDKENLGKLDGMQSHVSVGPEVNAPL